MIILEKKVGNEILKYVIDNNTVVRDYMGTREELVGFYNLFLFTNFHNAYPLNADYLVADGMEKLKMGKVVINTTPFRTADVVDNSEQKKKHEKKKKR